MGSSPNGKSRIPSSSLPPLRVGRAFFAGRLPSRDDPNDVLAGTVAVTDDEHAKRGTEAQQHEAILVVRVIGDMHDPAMFVQKGRPGFIEGDALFLPVRPVLGGVPFEPELVRHNHSVPTS